jgi:hypothetical protein
MNAISTPKTDAAAFKVVTQHYSDGDVAEEEVVSSDFARQLEREITQATQWQPIETAPRDGTLIVLKGPPVDPSQPPRIKVGKWDKFFLTAERHSPWMQEDGCEFIYPYYYKRLMPTEWSPLPRA